MPWWGWVIIGTLLFSAELFAIGAGFYLVFIGAGAITVGVVMLFGINLPVWGQVLLFAILSIASMLLLRRQLYEKLRFRTPDPVDSLVGDRVIMSDYLAPGESCRTQHRGSTWTAVNVGNKPIAAGDSASIGSIDGFTLNVENDEI